jgi:hypothetical protein
MTTKAVPSRWMAAGSGTISCRPGRLAPPSRFLGGRPAHARRPAPRQIIPGSGGPFSGLVLWGPNRNRTFLFGVDTE